MRKKVKYQEGGNTYQKFYNEYINSSAYKDRLIKSGYKDPEQVILDRLANVNNSRIVISNESNAVTPGKVFVNPAQGPIDMVASHEYGHKAGANKLGFYSNTNLNINQYENTQLKNWNKFRGQNNHLGKSHESKADIDSLRFLMQQNSLGTPMEEMDLDRLNKAKENKNIKDTLILNRLQQRYSDEDLIWLMNNIASNKNKKIPMARKGGIPKYQLAGPIKLEFPQQPVVNPYQVPTTQSWYDEHADTANYEPVTGQPETKRVSDPMMPNAWGLGLMGAYAGSRMLLNNVNDRNYQAYKNRWIRDYTRPSLLRDANKFGSVMSEFQKGGMTGPKGYIPPATADHTVVVNPAIPAHQFNDRLDKARERDDKEAKEFLKGYYEYATQNLPFYRDLSAIDSIDARFAFGDKHKKDIDRLKLTQDKFLRQQIPYSDATRKQLDTLTYLRGYSHLVNDPNLKKKGEQEMAQEYEKIRRKPIDDLMAKDSLIFVGEPWKNGTDLIHGQQDPKTNTTKVNDKTRASTLVHERAHKADVSVRGTRGQKNTEKLFEDIKNTVYSPDDYRMLSQDIEYFTDFSERQARHRTTQNWLTKNLTGYDYKKPMTTKEYEFLMKNTDKLPSDVKQLIRVYGNEQNFLKYLNEFQQGGTALAPLSQQEMVYFNQFNQYVRDQGYDKSPELNNQKLSKKLYTDFQKLNGNVSVPYEQFIPRVQQEQYNLKNNAQRLLERKGTANPALMNNITAFDGMYGPKTNSYDFPVVISETYRNDALVKRQNLGLTSGLTNKQKGGMTMNTPAQQAAGYYAYPNASSLTFPGKGERTFIPGPFPLIVKDQNGTQIMTDKPVKTMGTVVELPMFKEGGEVRIQAPIVERKDATIEAEKGELILGAGMPGDIEDQEDRIGAGLYKIGGNVHSKGGTPLKAYPGDFVFSNDKRLAASKEDSKLITGKEIKKLKLRTPAKMAQKYLGLNKFIDMAQDKDMDDITRKTALLNINNYIDKLSEIALNQEEKKGFPDGVPGFVAASVESRFDEAGLQAGLDQFRYGGQVPKYQTAGVVTDDIRQRARLVSTVPPGFTSFGNFGDKQYYRNASGQTVAAPTAIAGGTPGKPWENKMIELLQSGVTIEELAKQGHGTVPGLTQRFGDYYQPKSGTEDFVYTPIGGVPARHNFPTIDRGPLPTVPNRPGVQLPGTPTVEAEDGLTPYREGVNSKFNINFAEGYNIVNSIIPSESRYPTAFRNHEIQNAKALVASSGRPISDQTYLNAVARQQLGFDQNNNSMGAAGATRNLGAFSAALGAQNQAIAQVYSQNIVRADQRDSTLANLEIMDGQDRVMNFEKYDNKLEMLANNKELERRDNRRNLGLQFNQMQRDREQKNLLNMMSDYYQIEPNGTVGLKPVYKIENGKLVAQQRNVADLIRNAGSTTNSGYLERTRQIFELMNQYGIKGGAFVDELIKDATNPILGGK